MKTAFLAFTAFLLLVTGSFFTCNKKPEEIPFTEYSLAETSCQWINFESNKVIIINSHDELENYIDCTDDSYPEIDFSKYSLLLVLIKDVEDCNIDSKVEKSSLWQLSANKYEFAVDIAPSITANAAPFFLHIVIVTEKLNEKSKVELSVTIIKN